MSTSSDLFKLLRLSSQTLPVGAFSYSQGLEWVVDCNQVKTEDDVYRWIQAMLFGPFSRYELPLIKRSTAAWSSGNYREIIELNEDYLATRETHELRSETLQIGFAFRSVIEDMEIGTDQSLSCLEEMNELTYPIAFSFCCASESADIRSVLSSYAWCFIENQTIVAMKTIPLGQRAGQRLLTRLIPECEKAIDLAMEIKFEEWSNFAPLQAIASSRHEAQYSRLFRS